MFDSGAKAALAEIGELWNVTEKIVKRAERIRAQVVEPSINELRYAGRQLVDAVNLANKDQLTDIERIRLEGHIQDCRLRCYCAQHDAFDASILFVQRVIKTYEDEFTIALMHKHFPWLLDFKVLVLEADELIVSSREERGRRIEAYRNLAENFLPEIVRQYRRLVTTREALIALFEDQARNEGKEGSRFWLIVWVTIGAALGGGLVGAVVTILMTIFFHGRGVI